MKTLFIVLILALSHHALACSCLGIANAQQAAQGKNILVAKVTTVSVDESTGIGKIKFEKSYKGKLPGSDITVYGQDGANCAPSIPNSKSPWVVILSDYMGTGNYEMVGCADSVLSLSKDNKITTYFDAKVELTEDEFTQLINLEVAPTVKGMTCQGYVTKYHMNFAQTTPPSEDINHTSILQVQGTDFDDDATLTESLTQYGLPYPFKMYGSIYGTPGSLDYEVGLAITEPFSGMSTRQNVKVNIAESYNVGSLSMDSNKDLQGVLIDDQNYSPDVPFIGQSAAMDCILNLGLPLLPVTKKW